MTEIPPPSPNKKETIACKQKEYMQNKAGKGVERIKKNKQVRKNNREKERKLKYHALWNDVSYKILG